MVDHVIINLLTFMEIFLGMVRVCTLRSQHGEKVSFPHLHRLGELAGSRRNCSRMKLFVNGRTRFYQCCQERVIGGDKDEGIAPLEKSVCGTVLREKHE